MLEDAIENFWVWWDGVADHLADAIDDDVDTDIPEALSERVWHIHPDLDWQIVPGDAGVHSLNLVSGGSRTLRLVAEAWVRLSPNRSRWRFHPARLPFQPEEFLVRGREIDPAKVRFSLNPDPMFRRLDVVVTHPGLSDLRDDEARDVGLYLLDAALGEDGAERWMGVLGTADEGGDLSFGELAEAAHRWVTGWSGPGWEDVSDQYDGVVTARVDRSLKWIDHLDKLTYAEITIQSLTNDDDGQPLPLELRRLNSVTADLLDRLGDDAVLIGEATGDGERTLHLFVRSRVEVASTIEDWVEANGNRRIDHELMTDEQWSYAEQWD